MQFWLGIRSVIVTAALAKDRVILRLAHDEPWNGSTAADMDKDSLKKTLKRLWGDKRSDQIVEDGDRMGDQSGKGIAARKEAKIVAETLPPRTPSWMLVDYAFWVEILERMDQEMGGPCNHEQAWGCQVSWRRAQTVTVIDAGRLPVRNYRHGSEALRSHFGVCGRICHPSFPLKRTNHYNHVTNLSGVTLV